MNDTTKTPAFTGTQTAAEYREEIAGALGRLVQVAVDNGYEPEDLPDEETLFRITEGLVGLRERGRGWHTVDWELPTLYDHSPEGLTDRAARLLMKRVEMSEAWALEDGHERGVWDGKRKRKGGMMSGPLCGTGYMGCRGRVL